MAKHPAPSAASVKKAMVQPAPTRADQAAMFLAALEMIGNDCAYTVIHVEGNIWTVMFEGDDHPTVISFSEDKPELI